MSIVEEEFIEEDEDNHFEEDPVKGRQFLTEVATPPLHDQEGQIHQWDADHKLVEHHLNHSFF